MALEREKEHQAALQELKDDFCMAVEEAHAAANEEMEKRLAIE